MPKLPPHLQPKGCKHQTDEGLCYLGIDPGKSGGIACLCNGDVAIDPMPTTETDLWTYIGLLSGVAIVVIEHVTSSPQMGVTSSFTFGMGYGSLRMALVAAEIPFEPIRPQVWQKALGIPPRYKGTPKVVRKIVKGKPKAVTIRVGEEPKEAFKERLRAKAQQLYPKLPIWKEPRSKGKQLAICDALLIATYCQRKHLGRL